MEMVCPHGCGIAFDRDRERTGHVFLEPGMRSVAEDHHDLEWFRCPRCGGFTVELGLYGWGGDYDPFIDASKRELWRRRLFPTSTRTLPPEVPEPYRSDFTEAASILDISPQASAALARRTLQQVLKDELRATGRDLEKQIDSVLGGLPSQVADGLHALRNLGNFGAHPIKSTATGEVVKVEPGEAEWTLDIVEALFDHVFVGPARLEARRQELNEKLRAAGKPELPED